MLSPSSFPTDPAMESGSFAHASLPT